ncbi:hypothetical protein ColLi_00465 [Colletotrichum liriopes]|uniref:Uncharacterized protein n=1 Tax=Colletotrichum liriopes TaxID=708192 RepID=A0AA37GBQ7_9PEZI|nr:hypothetical protein ColLi_00465 [Colletotrichum liriopes]
MAFASRLWFQAVLFAAVAIIAPNLLAPESEATTNDSDGATSPDKTQLYKELYYKLQNLEKYPGILPKARRVLIGLLHEGLLIE